MRLRPLGDGQQVIELAFNFLLVNTDTKRCPLCQSPAFCHHLPPFTARLVWPACNPPHTDAVPHKRSFVLTAADRSPRFADGSLIRSRSINAVAAYCPSSPPAGCRQIVGRRRIVTRRRQRPRHRARQQRRHPASSCMFPRVVVPDVRPRRRLCCAVRLAVHRVATDCFNVSHSTIIAAAPCFHIVLFPPHDGAPPPASLSVCSSDANNRQPRRRLRALASHAPLDQWP